MKVTRDGSARADVMRRIVRIDAALCDGCGACVARCPEAAIRLVDGRARLVPEEFCDGRGVCVSACPQGAIVLEERVAPPFDAAGSEARQAAGGVGPEAEFRRRLRVCCQATACGRICRRLVKDPGRTRVRCVDVTTGAQIDLYEALCDAKFMCPDGHF